MNLCFLGTTPLFKGITESEIEKILPCLKSEEKKYEKGDFIY